MANEVYKTPLEFADIVAGATLTVVDGWKAVEILNSATSTGDITVNFTASGKSRTIRPGELLAMSFDGGGGRAFTAAFASGCIGGYTVLN